MKYLLIILCAIFSISAKAQVPNLTWGKRVHATEKLQVVNKVVTAISEDSSGTSNNSSKLITEAAAKGYARSLTSSFSFDSTMRTISSHLFGVDTLTKIATKHDLTQISGASTPTWAQTLASGSVLTSNVSVTSSSGVSYSQIMSGTNGSSVFQNSSSGGLQLVKNNAAGTFQASLGLQSDGSASSAILKSYDLTNQGTISSTNGVIGIASYPITFSTLNKIGINPGSSEAFYYENESGIRYKFPRNRPTSGQVLAASDNSGTLSWSTASSTGSNVGDSLVRIFDTSANHNERIGANTVALSGKLNTSDSSLIQRQSESLMPTRKGYIIYPQIAGTKPFEILNLGNTASSSSGSQAAPVAIVKNNWSLLTTWNMKFDSSLARWQQVRPGLGASAMEVGQEGLTLHSVPAGTLFNGTWHEMFQCRNAGVDGVSGLTSGQFNQAKAPLFIAYKSSAYTDDTHPWAGGSSTADNPMIWLQTNETKGTTGEFIRIESNSPNSTGGQFYFRKSRGSYASKTVSSSGDNAGILAYSQWDGSAYQSTARILSYMDSAANTNRVPQSLAFQTSQNTMSNVTTRMRIWNTGAIVIGNGNTAPSTGAIVDIQSVTGALVLPRMTTTQRDALTTVAGAMVFCTDCTATKGSTGVSQTYDGSTWNNHY